MPACAVASLTSEVDLNQGAGVILLKAKLGDESAVCLWDTGAETNFLSQHFVERHGLLNKLNKSDCSVRYADCNSMAIV